MGLFSFLRRKQPQPLGSLRRGSPDPAFMGEFLVHSFVDSHFGLSNADLDGLVASLPEAIRDAARYWTVLYLCWVYRMKIRAKYGDDFFATAFQAARARFAVSDQTAKFGEELRFWFEQFDHGAKNLGQTDQGVEIPMEYFAALALLALSPDSPFFRQTKFPNAVELDLASVLEKGKESALRLIEVTGDIGGPLMDDAV
jgi:hypothetical protein